MSPSHTLLINTKNAVVKVCEDNSEIKNIGDFPGGAVFKNLPANEGNTGFSPGLGRFHMPRSN